MVICRTEDHAEKARSVISTFLSERGLELSSEKTKVTHIREGFDFLGWNFRKYEVQKKLKMLIKPSKGSLEAIKESLNTAILGQGKALTQDQLIQILNPKIRGWCNYHRSSVASRTFDYLDSYLFDTLYRWGLRRHRNKSKHWVFDRYWHRTKDKRFDFSTENNRLLRPCDVRIRRHVKVRSNTNPYINIGYYAERRARHRYERGYRDRSFTS
ncbi:MAG: maturase [archaeon]|nr:maturase [archaeon]